MPATVTVQFAAVYVVPVGAPPSNKTRPYVAETKFLIGPKFAPLSVTFVPPVVGIEVPPVTAVTVGAVYDAVALDDELVWLPAVTCQTKSAPTPATLEHRIPVFSV